MGQTTRRKTTKIPKQRSFCKDKKGWSNLISRRFKHKKWKPWNKMQIQPFQKPGKNSNKKNLSQNNWTI